MTVHVTDDNHQLFRSRDGNIETENASRAKDQREIDHAWAMLAFDKAETCRFGSLMSPIPLS